MDREKSTDHHMAIAHFFLEGNVVRYFRTYLYNGLVCFVLALLIVAVDGRTARAQNNDITLKTQDSSTTASIERHPMVILETSLGNITLELDATKAPKTVENFLGYVDDHFYDNTIFHRVINHFMIQGGGFAAGMQEKNTKPPIENEANNGLKNTLGSIAMARTNDPHSASAQFFINVKDNPFLDYRESSVQGWGYAVFGKVIEGMDTIDKIKAVQTGQKGLHGDVPIADILLIKARRVSSQQP